MGELVETIQYQYPTFFLTMYCYWCEVLEGNLELLEHQDARWLTKEELDQVEWLPADVALVKKLKQLL